jgi:hypothetical protein
LGAAATIFFASISTPKLGQQFAGAAFGFLKGVATAVATGAAIGIGAAVGAAAGVVGGSMAAAKGIGGKLKAAATSLPRAAGAFTKEAFTRTPAEIVKGVALAPLPEAARKEAIESWRRRASPEEVEKRIKRIEETKGPKGVLKIVEDPFATELEKRKAIKIAMEGRYDSENWAKNEKIRKLILRNYEEAAEKRDKKTLAMIERRLIKSLEEDSELRESFKRIATKYGMYDEAKEGPYIERIIKGVKSADDLKQLQGKWWENTAIREMAERFWTGAQWGAAAREFGKELVDALEPLINQLRTFKQTNDVIGYLHFVWDRPGLARYSATGAAQELGFPSWYELAPEGVRRRYRNMREILAEKP